MSISPSPATKQTALSVKRSEDFISFTSFPSTTFKDAINLSIFSFFSSFLSFLSAFFDFILSNDVLTMFNKSFLLGAHISAASEGVDALMGPEIMGLHVVPVTSIAHPWLVDHSFHKGLQIGIIDDSSEVALEVNHINQIKARQGREETNVSFRKFSFSISNQPFTSIEVDFQLIKASEQGSDGFIIGRLSLSETRLVYTVVDRFIICINHGVNVSLKFGWAQC